MAKKPKLALIPSGYKVNKVYSVLPSDGVGDFNFSRSGTATRVNKQGLIETVSSNVPRLNYPLIDGVVSGCPSLLLEPARTNLLTYSEDFSDASWGKSNVSVTANSEISPSGDLTADTLTKSSTGVDGTVTKVVSSTSTGYVGSIFIKKDTNTSRFPEFFLRSSVASGENEIYVQLNTSTGETAIRLQFGTASASTPVLINGYWRISLYTLANTDIRFGIRPSASNTLGTFDANATGSIVVWGAQLEQGSYPTSYIPTNGSTVTRSAETCNGAGNASTFNDSEGVLFAEIAYLNPTTLSNLRIAISDGTSSNRILIQNVSSNPNRLQFYVISNGGTSTDFYTNLSDITSFNKIAFKYKENDFSVWINGIKVLTDISGSTFSDGTLNEFSFDGGDGLFDWYGKTKQIQYFDTALTDSDLETLTSWTSFSDMAEGQLYTIE